MKISKEITIGEIVANNYNASVVFEKFGIDFYCNGNISIDKVCQDKNLSPSILISDLINALSKADNNYLNYNSLPITLLIHYIENEIHQYINENKSALKKRLYTLCLEHGEIYSELLGIHELLEECFERLKSNMEKEFVIFFYVRRVESAKKRNLKITTSVSSIVEVVKKEHMIISEKFRHISDLSHNYNPPHNCTNLHMATFALLKEFERKLIMLFHLENNILFPKVIDIEDELLKTE